MKYQYNIFGLNVSAKFKLGHYPISSFTTAADVVIEKKKLKRPDDGLERTVYKPYSVFNPNLFYLEVTDIAKYLVKGNQLIYLDKDAKASWQDVFAFLFDTVFTVALLKNDIFVFHAMAVAFGKKAIMFCGPAGIGKSTLAASLAANKGARIIEDDKCLISWNRRTRKAQLKNQYPFIELWQPQLGFVKKIKNASLNLKLRKNIAKHRIDIKNHAPKRAVQLDKIVLLNMNNMKDQIDYHQIKGIRKVNVVKNFSHLNHLVSVLGKNKEHFQTIAKVVQGVEVHSVNKSRLTKFPDFLKFIEDEIIG